MFDCRLERIYILIWHLTTKRESMRNLSETQTSQAANQTDTLKVVDGYISCFFGRLKVKIISGCDDIRLKRTRELKRTTIINRETC